MRTTSRSAVWLSVWTLSGFLPLIFLGGGGGGGGLTGFFFCGGIGAGNAAKKGVEEVFGSSSGIQVKYDPGLRIGAAGGYQFCKYFSAEVESGILYNSIKSITGSPSTDASLVNVPLLANAVFHIPLESNFVPYCGFGFGGSTSVLTIDHATIAGRQLDGDDSDFVWAAQAFAGVRYEFNDRMGVGFGYKFMATGQ